MRIKLGNKLAYGNIEVQFLEKNTPHIASIYKGEQATWQYKVKCLNNGSSSEFIIKDLGELQSTVYSFYILLEHLAYNEQREILGYLKKLSIRKISPYLVKLLDGSNVGFCLNLSGEGNSTEVKITKASASDMESKQEVNTVESKSSAESSAFRDSMNKNSSEPSTEKVTNNTITEEIPFREFYNMNLSPSPSDDVQQGTIIIHQGYKDMSFGFDDELLVYLGEEPGKCARLKVKSSDRPCYPQMNKRDMKRIIGRGQDCIIFFRQDDLDYKIFEVNKGMELGQCLAPANLIKDNEVIRVFSNDNKELYKDLRIVGSVPGNIIISSEDFIELSGYDDLTKSGLYCKAL